MLSQYTKSNNGKPIHVFVSWSGPTSRRVGHILRRAIRMLVPSISFFISDEDIQAGTRWHGKVAEALAASDIAMICLTPSNLRSPWMLFESGAIARAFHSSLVIPVLIGVNVDLLPEPLRQFNAVCLDKPDALVKIVTSIATRLNLPEILMQRLYRRAHCCWPKIKLELRRLIHAMQDEESPEIAASFTDEINTLAREVYDSGHWAAKRAIRKNAERSLTLLRQIQNGEVPIEGADAEVFDTYLQLVERAKCKAKAKFFFPLSAIEAAGNVARIVPPEYHRRTQTLRFNGQLPSLEYVFTISSRSALTKPGIREFLKTYLMVADRIGIIFTDGLNAHARLPINEGFGTYSFTAGCKAALVHKRDENYGLLSARLYLAPPAVDEYSRRYDALRLISKRLYEESNSIVIRDDPLRPIPRANDNLRIKRSRKELVSH